ncbi:MAG: tail fiber protein [Trichodesmium sp. St4_bin8_1]|nr:tail fiber protein [Trichodesmium sp. St4_bin8_1]
MSPIMPFEFFWCYEPEDEDEEEYCQCLLLGTPETVTPLHIGLRNTLSDKVITIASIPEVTIASAEHYHFKLTFQPGILADPDQIKIEETESWSLYIKTDPNYVCLYLLWTEAPIILNPGQETEVILTGVAGLANNSATEAILTEVIDLANNSASARAVADVNINWIIGEKNISIAEVKFPGQDDSYDTTTTLTLEMKKTSGKSNIPLYVGFVGSNKVFNTHDNNSRLQLRITNTNLSNADNSAITFNYNANSDQCSQLVIVLEVGDKDSVPWALGTQDDVNGVNITINNWQQLSDGPEEIQVNGQTKALEWTFIPQESDVVLNSQETLLINLDGITTAHPTGETNLYLRYQYIDGYRDGQFVCQIEKAPLVFDEKVRIGTNKSLDGLLTVKDGISLDAPGEINHTGTLIFRSDTDTSNDDISVKFYKQKNDLPLMELTSRGDLQFPAKSGQTGQRINLWGPEYGVGTQGNTTYFRTNGYFAWYLGGSHEETSTTPGDGGRTQMLLDQEGNLEVGCGRIKDSTGWVVPVGTIVAYAGPTAPDGWFLCDGRSLNSGDYPDLYKVIGSDYGNSTIFRLPDLQGRVAIGLNNGDQDFKNLAQTGGDKKRSLLKDNMPKHSHSVHDPGHWHGIEISDDNSEEGHIRRGGYKQQGYMYINSNKNTTGITVQNAGNGTPFSILPPYIIINYIIKY